MSHNYCNLGTSIEELLKIFPNIHTDCENLKGLSEQAILVVKNKDVYDLNNTFQSYIQSDLVICKPVNIVVEADKALII